VYKILNITVNEAHAVLLALNTTYIFSAALFYAHGAILCLAIFIMVRLDTTGVGLKSWGRRRACLHDYPMTLDPLLHGEQKPDHDFPFPFPF
jgi:hypothetical protein